MNPQNEHVSDTKMVETRATLGSRATGNKNSLFSFLLNGKVFIFLPSNCHCRSYSITFALQGFVQIIVKRAETRKIIWIMGFVMVCVVDKAIEKMYAENITSIALEERTNDNNEMNGDKFEVKKTKKKKVKCGNIKKVFFPSHFCVGV